MAKKYISVNLEKSNLDNLVIASKYFNCSYTQLLGLLLKMANLHNSKTVIAGEPASTAFNKHVNKANDELRKLIGE